MDFRFLKRITSFCVFVLFYVISAQFHWLPAVFEHYTGSYVRDQFYPVANFFGIDNQVSNASEANLIFQKDVRLQKKRNKVLELINTISDVASKTDEEPSIVGSFGESMLSKGLHWRPLLDRIFREPNFLHVSKQMDFLKEQSIVNLEKRSYLLLDFQKNPLLVTILENKKGRFVEIEKLEFDLLIEKNPSITDYVVYSLSGKKILSHRETTFPKYFKSKTNEIEILKDGFIVPIYGKKEKRIGYLQARWNILLDPNLYLSRSSFSHGVDMLLTSSNKELLSPEVYLSALAQSFIKQNTYNGKFIGTGFTNEFADEELHVRFRSIDFSHLRVVFLYEVISFSFYIIAFLKFSSFIGLLFICIWLLLHYWPLYKKVLALISSTQVSVLEKNLEISLSLQAEISDYLKQSQSVMSNIKENKKKRLESIEEIELVSGQNKSEKTIRSRKKRESYLEKETASFKKVLLEEPKKKSLGKEELDRFPAEFKSVSISTDVGNLIASKKKHGKVKK